MTDLRLDLAALGAAASRADRIRAGLSRVQSIAHDTAALTGHGGLAGRVVEFADSWDASQERLAGSLETVAGALRTIAETFGRLDGRLSDGVARTGVAAGGERR